jgi:hypothetical protein
VKKILSKPQGGKNLKWILDNPDAVAEAIAYIERILSIESHIVPGGKAGGRQRAVISDSNIILPLPVQFNARVENAASYTTTYAAVSFGVTWNAGMASYANAMSTQLAATNAQVIALTAKVNELNNALKKANINLP